MGRLTEEIYSQTTEKMNMAVASLLEKMLLFFENKPAWIFFQIDYLDILTLSLIHI